MEALLNFFEGFADFIFAIGDFIISGIMDIGTVIMATGMIAMQIPSYFAWMPTELVVMIVFVFAVVVLYKILGREG